MKEISEENLFNPRVAISKLPVASYEQTGEESHSVAKALARAVERLGWSTDESGVFGGVIPEGARVLVKPNLVLHQNEGTGGMAPMVTHPSLIHSVVEAVLRSNASEVTVGDAPVQLC